MPKRIHRWVAANAPWLLTATVATTLLALAQLIDLRTGEFHLLIDSSFDATATQSPADRALDETVRLRFGGAEGIAVVLQVADIYSTESLKRLDRLTRRLAALGGVDTASSLSTTAVPYMDGRTLKSVKADRASLENSELPGILRRAATGNAVVAGQLASADGRAAVVLVTPLPIGNDNSADSDLVGRILAVADDEQAAGVTVSVAGTAVMRSALNQSVVRQLRSVVPTIILVVGLLLALAFPTLHGVILPGVTIAIALLWTLASLSLLGRPLNLVTALVPPLIVTMGLAYCAHILSEFDSLEHEDASSSGVDRIAQLLKEVAVPVAVTGLTTIIGFLALLLNSQQALFEFAWLSALGTAYLVVLALLFVPAVLRYVRPRSGSREAISVGLFETGSEQLSRFDEARRPLILAVAGVVFLVSLAFASRIQVGDAFIGIFPEDSRVRMDYDAVNRAIGGVNPLYISFDGGSADSFTDPTALRTLDSLQAWLREQPEVGSVTGLADHVRLLHRYLGAGTTEGIPDSRDAIRQLMFVGQNDAMRGVVNPDRSSTLIRLRLNMDDTAPVVAFLDRLASRLQQLPPEWSPHVGGNAAVMAESVRLSTAGQMRGVLLALGLIYLCLSVQFMSLRIGLLASLPTVLQTAVYFGALGLLAIPLNTTTALVECLVLGLAIDDTIHYLARFNSAAKRSGSEKVAAASALKAVLRPVTLTKAILAIGFLTLLTGEMRNQVLFGWLAALTLLCAWMVDAFVTPALMSGLRIVTLWDTLRLNLGRDVQESVPLFRGLTKRQARVFALMANLHTVPAGTRLITEGEASSSVYVVIDGELSVWVGSAGARDELARLGRGAVVGEQGYFGQKRSANVDVLSTARLLRFDQTDQDRLCEAYPAIAARVFLSLNRLQAARQAERLRHEPLGAGDVVTL